jgi:hypothetical protein
MCLASVARVNSMLLKPFCDAEGYLVDGQQSDVVFVANHEVDAVHAVAESHVGEARGSSRRVVRTLYLSSDDFNLEIN